MARRRITDKQRAFVAHLIRTDNATEAYLLAGYHCKNREVASANASSLLKSPQIKMLVEREQKKLQRRLDVSTYRVLYELANIGYLDPRRITRPDGTIKDLREMDEDVSSCISSVEVEEEVTTKPGANGEGITTITTRTKKVRFCDKIAALEKLGKHLNLFNEKEVAESLRPLSVNVQINVEKQLENLSPEALEQLIERLSQPMPAIAGPAETSDPGLSEASPQPPDLPTLRP